MGSVRSNIAIIGAGPAGSTCGAFLRKYNPNLSVSIFERAEFPREHVGESLLPIIGTILDELGVWERIEACGFPVKVGATYRWGVSSDLWDFNLTPNGEFRDEPRPAKFEGQRRATAFQVDRARYDKVLADWAAELGCDLRFGCAVRHVEHDGDRVTGFVLDDESHVEADYYVDASGHAGLLRRSLGIESEEPSALRNVAFWDYWRNPEWATTIGVGGTRVQVLSLGYGWIWFIPVGPDRSSIGLVCPAEFYKKSGLSPQQMYAKALAEEPRVRDLIKNATPENKLTTTKDWSFVARRKCGDNWFLVGEALGFADPILAAGLSIAHMSSRELACVILEAYRGGDLDWLRGEYERRNDRRVRQHIRFADYWYRSNAHFSDLKEHTAEIAKDAGLDLDPDRAFQWLGTGGFIEEETHGAGFATMEIAAVHLIRNRFSSTRATSTLDGCNSFRLNLDGAEPIRLAKFVEGRVLSSRAMKRQEKVLPLNGLFGWICKGLSHSAQLREILNYLQREMTAAGNPFTDDTVTAILQHLDVMVRDGWVVARAAGAGPRVSHEIPLESPRIKLSDSAARPTGGPGPAGP